MSNPTDDAERASWHLAQARRLYDSYEHKAMPSEVAIQIENHLRSHQHHKIAAEEKWLAEPQYKHDMLAFPTPGGMIPGGGGEQPRISKQTKAFLTWMQKGEYAPAEVKATLVENADGQKLVPVDYAGTILQEVARVGVIRSMAYVRPTTRDRVDIGAITVGTPTWGRLEVTGGPPADALGAAPTTRQITVHELTALAKIGVEELADADGAPEVLADIVRQAVAAQFAQVEDDAFAAGAGDGSVQPWGITTRATAAGGNLITQGFAAAASGTVTADNLKALVYDVPSWARTTRSAFLASADAAEAVAMLKNSDGDFLLQRDASAAEPETLFGYPFKTVGGMPSMATAGVTDPSVVFGDLYAGYMIASRQQFTVQRLNELYAAEGKVGFLFKLRVGGDVIRPKAFARLLL